MNLKTIFFSIIIGCLSQAFGQSVLTLENAIKIGLENNYSIVLAEQDKGIAKSQNNIGNAGMSPIITTTASTSLASVNSYQEFATGANQERKGAQSTNNNLAVNLNWTLFDGLKMFAIKKRLNLAENISDLNYKQTLQNSIYDISIAYFDLVRLQELIKAAKQNLDIYEEREKISKLRYEIGLDAKIDLALIQLDKNRVVADLKRLDLQLFMAKANLNRVLARSADEDFTVTDPIEIKVEASYDELKKNVLSGNLTLLASMKTESLMDQYVKEARGVLMPIIQLTSSYNILRSRNQAGLLLTNQQAGLNAGLTASWVLFNGFKNSQFVQERKLRYVSQQYLTRQVQLQLDVLLYTQYKSFAVQKEIMLLEKQNLDFAQSITVVATERYRVGKASILETKEIQKNIEDAQARYISALFEAKKAEIELLRATSQLVK